MEAKRRRKETVLHLADASLRHQRSSFAIHHDRLEAEAPWKGCLPVLRRHLLLRDASLPGSTIQPSVEKKLRPGQEAFFTYLRLGPVEWDVHLMVKGAHGWMHGHARAVEGRGWAASLHWMRV